MTFSATVSALQGHQNELYQIAQNIAGGFPRAEKNQVVPESTNFEQTPSVDLTENIVNLRNVKRLSEAQIRVLKAQDEMLGLAIDLKA